MISLILSKIDMISQVRMQDINTESEVAIDNLPLGFTDSRMNSNRVE